MNKLPARAFPVRLARAFCVAALASIAFGTHAQDAGAPTGLDAGLTKMVRDLALEGSYAAQASALAAAQGAAPGTAPKAMPRIDIAIGQLDPRLRLAPCQRVEPYLPPGTRLWGKARIGLRCTEGQVKWNVYLPVTVKVYGPALVATSGVAAGAVLTAADLTKDEVDLTEENSPIVLDANAVVGRVLAQALKPGQALRVAHLKVRQWFAAGDTVKIVAQGDGFNVSGEAQALTNGYEGQTARVRTESGRVLSGQPVGDRQMDVTL